MTYLRTPRRNQLAPRPDTQSRPENRHGTAAATNWARWSMADTPHSIGPIVYATPRQYKKAMRIVHDGREPQQVGRVQRALIAHEQRRMAFEADAEYYGYA